MKSFIYNTKNIIILVLFILFFISSMFLLPIEANDENWNFQNIYKMNNGYTLYSNANAIITPIFYYLGLIFFNFFGATMLTFRFFNIFIFAIYFILFYFIFKSLKVSKHIIVLFLSIILVQIHSIINSGANYNPLCLVFILLGILTYLNLYEKKYFHYLQGIIVFLAFFTKQNLGAYYALSIVVFELINKKTFVNFVINQFKKFSTFCIGLIFSLFLFYLNGNLNDFINYCFGGIFDFGSSNIGFYVDFYIIVILVSTLITYFYITFSKNLSIPLENKRNLNLFACISIGTTFSVFPIFNTAHFLFILPLYLLLLFYFLDFAILEDCFNTQKSSLILFCISAFILIFMIIRLYVTCISETNNYRIITDASSPFYRMRISSENFEKIPKMVNYIKEKNNNKKNVIIISSDSCLTMIPLKQNNNAFDLAFKGNLGYNGENNLIKKIKSLKNTEFLIYTNKEDCFWQESETIREFITKNLTKTGEILNYSIYELPNN